MSKKVLITLAAGFLLIIAGIFLLKHELTAQYPEPDYLDLPDDQEEAEPVKVVKEKKPKTETNVEAVTVPGTEN
jgi:hypothetical protein